MEKEIEEIKKIIDERCETELGQVHTTYGKITKTVGTRLIAKDIYNAGYHKVDDIRRETASEICTKIINGIYKCNLTVCTVKEIAKEYGVEFD